MSLRSNRPGFGNIPRNIELTPHSEGVYVGNGYLFRAVDAKTWRPVGHDTIGTREIASKAYNAITQPGKVPHHEIVLSGRETYVVMPPHSEHAVVVTIPQRRSL